MSNVTLEHVQRVRKMVPIVAVQNRYSFADREWDYLLNYCEAHGLSSCHGAPLGQNREANAALEAAARELGVTPLQVALAWLLRRSSVVLPIPRTSSPIHLQENVAAAALKLPDPVFAKLSAITPAPANLRG
jgi:aryl-alcohol dehydrogenase-like predicted oxidoreductase